MKEKKSLNIQIGSSIRNARERACLTQSEFGELVSLDTKNVSDIERGVTGIKISTLKRICEKLSISSDTLLFDNQCKNNIDYMAERMRRLPPEKYLIVEDLLNKIFQTFSLLDE